MRKLARTLLCVLLMVCGFAKVDIFASSYADDKDFSQVQKVEYIHATETIELPKTDDSKASGGNGVNYYYFLGEESPFFKPGEIDYNNDYFLVTFKDSSTLQLNIYYWVFDNEINIGNTDYIGNNYDDFVIKLGNVPISKLSAVNKVEYIHGSNIINIPKTDDSKASGGNGVNYYYFLGEGSQYFKPDEIDYQNDYFLITFNDSSTFKMPVLSWDFNGRTNIGNNEYIGNTYDYFVVKLGDIPIQDFVTGGEHLWSPQYLLELFEDEAVDLEYSTATDSSFEDFVNNVTYKAPGSRIALMTDVTLDKDIKLHHFNMSVEGTEHTGITIDLNGHDINTNGHSIGIYRQSCIHFVNESSNPSKIFGTNDRNLINNYGDIYCKKTNIENSSECGDSFAVETHPYARITIDEKSTIEGYSGLSLIQDHIDIENTDISCIDFSGKIIAGKYGMSLFCPNEIDELETYVRIYGTSPSIESSGIGVYSFSDAEIAVENASIKANNAFKIGAGKLQLNSGNLTCSGDAIVVDENSNFTKSKVNISVCDNTEIISQDGSLVASSSEENLGTISNIEFYSFGSTQNNNKYLLYDDVNNVFRYDNTKGPFNVNDKSAIHIFGGIFSASDIGDYVKPPLTIMAIGTNYCPCIKNISVDVSNISEFKEALENPALRTINVTNNITSTDMTSIVANTTLIKTIELNNKTINNVEIRILDKQIVINNGHIENSLGTILFVQGGKAEINNSTIKSVHSNAIVLNIGELKLSKSEVNGSDAIYVNKESDGDKVSIESDDSKIVSNNGVCLNVNKTNEQSINTGDARLQFWNSELLGNDNNPAIKMLDNADVGLNSSKVYGQYGVYAKAGYAHIFEDNTIEGKIAAVYANNELGNSSIDRVVTIDCRRSTYKGYDTFQSVGSPNISVSDGKYECDVNGRIVNLIGTDINPNFRIIGAGLFTKFVSDEEIGKKYTTDLFEYHCLRIADSGKYQYTIVHKKKDANSYANVTNVTDGLEVIVDETQLDKLTNDSERDALDNPDVVLTVTDERDSENINKFVKGNNEEYLHYLDISVNKNSNDAVKKVDEVENFQIITILIDNLKSLHSTGELSDIADKMPNNLVIHHRHGNEVTTLKKVSEVDGRKLQEECYFVTTNAGKNYINIVTRRFSTFAIVGIDGLEEVPTSGLKQNHEFTLNYANKYDIDKGGVIEPLNAAYDTDKTLNRNEFSVIYEGNDANTTYYSSIRPVKKGSYKVTWIVKDTNENLSGRGFAYFEIVGDKSKPKHDYTVPTTGAQ